MLHRIGIDRGVDVRVISVTGQKGGVGKSTTAMNLAATLSRANKVLVVDVDPQKTSTQWAERAGEELPFDFASNTDPSILAQLRKLDHDVIIVDTPGNLGSADVLNAVLSTSDFAILPLTPAFVDIEPVHETVRDFIIPNNVPYRLLLNRVNRARGDKRLEAWKELLDQGQFFEGVTGLPRFTNHIRMSALIEDMPLEGKVVTQYSDTRASQAAIQDYTMVSLELTSIWANERKAS